MTEKTTLPEAGAVWFIKYATPEGFEECLTLRDNNGLALLDKATAARKKLIKHGATPIGRSNHKATDPEKQVCPIHQVEMSRKSKDGQSWYSHKAYTVNGKEYWCRGKAKEQKS